MAKMETINQSSQLTNMADLPSKYLFFVASLHTRASQSSIRVEHVECVVV